MKARDALWCLRIVLANMVVRIPSMQARDEVVRGLMRVVLNDLPVLETEITLQHLHCRIVPRHAKSHAPQVLCLDPAGRGAVPGHRPAPGAGTEFCRRRPSRSWPALAMTWKC